MAQLLGFVDMLFLALQILVYILPHARSEAEKLLESLCSLSEDDSNRIAFFCKDGHVQPALSVLVGDLTYLISNTNCAFEALLVTCRLHTDQCNLLQLSPVHQRDELVSCMCHAFVNLRLFSHVIALLQPIYEKAAGINYPLGIKTAMQYAVALEAKGSFDKVCTAIEL